MVKTLALVILTLSLAGCPTDPPACVFLACDSGSQCPNGVCGGDGLCVYAANDACTTGGNGSTSGSAAGSSTAAGSTSAGTSTSGGISATAGSGTGGHGTSGGVAATSGGATTSAGTTGSGATIGGVTTGGGTTDAGCLAPCAPCIMGGALCCDVGSGTGQCDDTAHVCQPPSGGVGSCSMTNACMPVSLSDGGFCSPLDGGCFCGADYDCCSGGCCDLSSFPGKCVSNSGIAPGFHRGPQPSGGGTSGLSCLTPLCSVLGAPCSINDCCGGDAGVLCQNNACCQSYDGGCVSDNDCCGNKCDSNTFTCR